MGGLTATYRLFETLLADGLDVHYLNLILADEVPRFQGTAGTRFPNPQIRCLTLLLSPAGHVARSTARAHGADRAAGPGPDGGGFGDISGSGSQTTPQKSVTFLTAGCMGADPQGYR